MAARILAGLAIASLAACGGETQPSLCSGSLCPENRPFIMVTTTNGSVSSKGEAYLAADEGRPDSVELSLGAGGWGIVDGFVPMADFLAGHARLTIVKAPPGVGQAALWFAPTEDLHFSEGGTIEVTVEQGRIKAEVAPLDAMHVHVFGTFFGECRLSSSFCSPLHAQLGP